jgi:hypothetical protein
MRDIWQFLHDYTPYSQEAELRRNIIDPSLPPLPGGQISKSDRVNDMALVKKGLSFLTPGYQTELVPLIRLLKDGNPDVSQAFKDVIQLANTGHEIMFDPGVPESQQTDMRRDIEESAKEWVPGCAGIHGIVNNMFSQLLVAGAISNEWVPDLKLNRIDRVVFIKPESIRWAESSTGKYTPYQKLSNSILMGMRGLVDGALVKLNTSTFRYYKLLGDAESPSGTPPYLAVLPGISTQSKMLENIDAIVTMMGLLGWGEALMAKPDQMDGESDAMYKARLESTLTELKNRVKLQMRDGVSVGYIDDHTFDFKQTVGNADGVDSLWAGNEQQIASALDFDTAFMGRSYNASETMVTILFTKMISQLTNIQNTVEHNLSYGLNLHLRLRGYKYQYIKVNFRKSTVTDELKYQQAMEIKGRIALQNYMMGTINSDMYAREMGYDAPVKNAPIIPIEIIAGKSQGQEKSDQKKKAKDESERKTTEKRKEGPVRKTKPRTSNP